jgi:hypothetical protein
MYTLRGLASLTTDLAGAIQRFEGACTGLSCRNNNPGNLRAGPGAIGTDSRGIAIFPDYATGEAALQHQIDLNISRGLTLDEFFAGKAGVYPGYAPAADSNDPNQYTGTVAGWLGIDPNTPLSSMGVTSGSVFEDTGASEGSPAAEDTFSSGLSGVALVAAGVAAIAVIWAMAD